MLNISELKCWQIFFRLHDLFEIRNVNCSLLSFEVQENVLRYVENGFNFSQSI